MMWWTQRVHLQFVYITLGFAFTLMLIQFVVSGQPSNPQTSQGRLDGLIELFGLASYPTYLFHGPIVMLVGSAILRWHLINDWRLTWVILTTTGIGTGLLLGNFAERPIMRWRTGYLKQLKTSGAMMSGPAYARGLELS